MYLKLICVIGNNITCRRHFKIININIQLWIWMFISWSSIKHYVSFYLVWFIVPNEFPNQIIHLFFIFLCCHFISPCYMPDHYVWFNDECTHKWYWWHYIYHVIYQITMSDLMMHVHTCFADNTIYTMWYMCSWKKHIHHGVCQITVSALMMNVLLFYYIYITHVNNFPMCDRKSHRFTNMYNEQYNSINKCW
jgi:hypothetical protein